MEYNYNIKFVLLARKFDGIQIYSGVEGFIFAWEFINLFKKRFCGQTNRQ